jgi:hypothetical protein
MGDRGYVCIRDGNANAPLYLYTHWRGSDLPDVVRKALAKRERWTDPTYLARIVFCEMLDGDCSTTGFGIGTVEPDAQTIVTLDCDAQEVYSDRGHESFADFVNAT